ncbi:MAG: hypothetical protein QOH86_1536 [Sphingomonadales bacterium]|jgi:hypothetical protein|nr:hypothetical protein [Sphingomonadales bacterium]
MMTFADFCRDYRLTPEERNEIVWHLARLRFEATLRALGFVLGPAPSPMETNP